MGCVDFCLGFDSRVACVSNTKQRGRRTIQWSLAGLMFVYLTLVSPALVAAETPTPAPASKPAQTARFSGSGDATSEVFQLAAGRYEISLAIAGNGRESARGNWKIELFRRPGDALMLESSGRNATVRTRVEVLIWNTSWNLWFRLGVERDANWTVAFERTGELPAVDSAPSPSAQSATARRTPAAAAWSARFASKGGAKSEIIQLTEGRYQVSLTVRGNDRRFALDTWELEFFRRLGQTLYLVLESSGWGASDNWQGELIVRDSSWNLWFTLDVADDARWSVTLTRIGDLSTPILHPQRTPQPRVTPQPTQTSRPTPTRSPTPQTFKSCQDVPESLIVVDSQGRRAVPRNLVPSAPDGDNDGFACGGQLEITPTPEATRTPPPTRTPRTYQSCQDVPESLIGVDSQGRRAVPRNLVPSAPDGDNDGFACGGQLELVPKPASTRSIESLRNAVSLELNLTILPSIQTAVAYAEQRDWRRSGNYMELAAGSCDLARGAVAEIASLSSGSVWDTVHSHLGRACRSYWNAASAFHSGNGNAALRSLENGMNALGHVTNLVRLD